MIFSPQYRKFNKENKADEIANRISKDNIINSFGIYKELESLKKDFGFPFSSIGSNLLMTKAANIINEKDKTKSS
jgi:hypothetical protein